MGVLDSSGTVSLRTVVGVIKDAESVKDGPSCERETVLDAVSVLVVETDADIVMLWARADGVSEVLRRVTVTKKVVECVVVSDADNTSTIDVVAGTLVDRVTSREGDGPTVQDSDAVMPNVAVELCVTILDGELDAVASGAMVGDSVASAVTVNTTLGVGDAVGSAVTVSPVGVSDNVFSIPVLETDKVAVHVADAAA